MSINKNLRALRTAKGMTQEDAANQMGLTRQAISSYESGRTQPDLETLMRLAEVYGTDLDAVLYGKSRAQTEEQGLKWTAGLVMAITLTLTLARALLCWLANRMFPPNGLFASGMQAAEGKTLLEAHFTLMSGSEAMEGLASTVLLVGGIILLVLLWKKSRPLPVRWKLGCAAVMAAGMAVCTLPFAWTDELFGWRDYMIFPEVMAARVAVFLLLSLLLDLLKQRRRHG